MHAGLVFASPRRRSILFPSIRIDMRGYYHVLDVSTVIENHAAVGVIAYRFFAVRCEFYFTPAGAGTARVAKPLDFSKVH
jgi:hypothetical protein